MTVILGSVEVVPAVTVCFTDGITVAAITVVAVVAAILRVIIVTLVVAVVA